MSDVSTPQTGNPILDAGAALITLTAMETVLGIDNIVFIALLSGRLPEHQRAKARQIGLGLALITRVLFLLTVTWIMGAANTKLFTIPILDHLVSGRDLILILGGLFLIWKATHEIHNKLEGKEGQHEDQHPHEQSEAAPPVNPAAAGAMAAVAGAGAASGAPAASASRPSVPARMGKPAAKPRSFWGTVGQILVIDIVFSIDSVVTAVGMAQQLWVMVAAVMISVGIMLIFAGPISAYVEKHPTLKMLALSFLLLIGMVLLADGLGQHISKGYIYFAMAFSLSVEVLNLIVKARSERKAAATRGAQA